MNKQLFKFIITIVTIGLFQPMANAQSCALNGLYTIDHSVPTSGTNFNSFNAAIAQLDTCGVSGSVVFNVRSGLYYEQVVIGKINGASGSNTITFQADPNNRQPVELTYEALDPSINYVVRMDSASYIHLEGLSMKALNADYGTVIELLGRGKDITIKDNILTGVPSNDYQDTEAYVLKLSSASKYDQCHITGNTIYNGSVGVSLQAEEIKRNRGNLIQNNIFRNFGASGIITTYQDSIIVTNNQFSNFSSVAAGRVSGVDMRSGAYFKFADNMITLQILPGTLLAMGILIEGYDSSSTHFNSNIITNNAISVSGVTPILATATEAVSGMYIYNNSDKVDIAFNSVLIGVNNMRATYLDEEGKYRFLNNNFLCMGGVVSEFEGLSSIQKSDNNNFFTTGSTLIAYGKMGLTATNLSDWQTASGHDSNSVSTDPQFIDPTDLRVYISAMDNLGTPIPGITTDIQGNPRSTTTPDIGAYEFTAYNEDIFTKELLSPVDSICGDSNTTVSVVIFNRGANDATGFDVGAIINGQDLSTIYSGTLASGERDTVEISGFNTVKGEMTEVQTYTNLSTDMNTTNDTLSTMVYIQSEIAPEPISEKGFFCASEPYDTLYFPEGVSAYQWLATNGDTLSISNGFIVGPLNTKDTTFILSPLGNDCSAPDGSITLEYIPVPVADFNINQQGPTETDFTVNFDGSISSNTNTFEWSFGDGSTATGDSVSHTYTADSTYEVQLIVTGACGSDTITKTVEVEGIGIAENKLAQSLKIYPNPVQSKLQISFEAQILGNTKIHIIDLSGKTIMQKEVSNTNARYNGEIDVTQITKGSYILRIESGDLQTIKRIIKQ